jgi:4-aminobutyrate aminotransferase-like enzyme
MARLLHAMGDVHPHRLKGKLARELSRITFERWAQPKSQKGKTIFCNSGFEAVEAALKTAMLVLGRPGVIAFEGAYHGVGYGALNATHRDLFRAPFLSQLRQFGHFVPFPRDKPALEFVEAQIRRHFRREKIGAILVEPIQVRGGVQIPPPEFLPLLRRLCDEHKALLILDEIYTGFGRTGKWFACEHSGTVPDVVCVGKALTGGFPLSACIGRAELMDAAWPRTTGEALHTSTFLGHPVGCAMALAQIAELRTRTLIERSAKLGRVLLSSLQALAPPERSKRGSALRLEARGLGLLAGFEVGFADGKPATDVALSITKQMLHRGYILLPEGECSNVLGFTPPLTVTRGQLTSAVHALREVLADAEGG